MRNRTDIFDYTQATEKEIKDFVAKTNRKKLEKWFPLFKGPKVMFVNKMMEHSINVKNIGINEVK